MEEAEERLVRARLNTQHVRTHADRMHQELMAMEALEADEERNVANGTPGEPYRDRVQLLDLMHAKMRELAAVQPAPAVVEPQPLAPAGELGAGEGEGGLVPADPQPSAGEGGLGAGEGGAGGAMDTASGGMGGASGGEDGAPAYKCYSKASTHTRTHTWTA
jgi:hypothetical protein